jgi:hypothetical protein
MADSRERFRAVGIPHHRPRRANRGGRRRGGWRRRFAVFLAFAMFDGGGAAEPAVGLDADDGVVTFEINPVAPGLGFVAGLEVFLAECGEHFRDGGRRREFREGGRVFP